MDLSSCAWNSWSITPLIYTNTWDRKIKLTGVESHIVTIHDWIGECKALALCNFKHCCPIYANYIVHIPKYQCQCNLEAIEIVDVTVHAKREQQGFTRVNSYTR